jgi:hypothetical protein
VVARFRCATRLALPLEHRRVCLLLGVRCAGEVQFTRRSDEPTSARRQRVGDESKVFVGRRLQVHSLLPHAVDGDARSDEARLLIVVAVLAYDGALADMLSMPSARRRGGRRVAPNVVAIAGPA